MEGTLALVALALLANKVIELLKYLRNKDLNAAVTLASVWVAGIVALAIAANSAVTESLVIPQTTAVLGSLDFGSLVLLGLMLTSTGSTVYDFKKAFDQHDSAKQPPLIEGPSLIRKEVVTA